MPDYKQTTITGTSWQRAWRVECENPLNGQRHIRFHEEQVVNADGQTISKPVGVVSVPFDAQNAITAFDLLNPETGEKQGTATYAQVYQLLHSFYIHAATSRDNSLIEPEAPSEEGDSQ